MSVILAATHLAAFALGYGVCFWVARHFTRAVSVDGHPALEFTTDHREADDMHKRPRRDYLTGGLLVLSSLLMVIVGFQVLAGRAQEQQRDREDRAFTSCIAGWGNDLIATVETRGAATARVDEAEERRDTTVDNVIATVILARQIPPRANEADFDRALAQAQQARARLDLAKARAAKVKERNSYESPRLVCQR